MSLNEYRRKRDFRRTPEPKGKAARGKGRRFVVQKHAARRLHYDFRLELDGVLKSWAVPKGPSLDPSERSLAVHVEDHPLQYGSFEGVIPPGEYGGGTVLLWDQGEWEPEEKDPKAAYQKGKLHFHLKGKRLKGRWTLVQMHGKASDDGKNWLLIKSDDAQARSGKKDIRDEDTSVTSGRSMEQIASDADRVWSSDTPLEELAEQGGGDGAPTQPINVSKLKGAKKSRLPGKFQPQLATLVRNAPAGDAWLHELKFDGYRLLCRIGRGKPRLITRRGNDWTNRFPTVAQAIGELGWKDSMLDGEVIALGSGGTSDFQALQNMMNRGRDEDIAFYAFDLPYYNGHDLTPVPLVERKRLLAQLLTGQPHDGVIRYSDHIAGRGRDVLASACRRSVEGIVSKRADSPYEQKRSRSWVKVKCLKRQEFVVGGWSDPAGSRQDFGSLLLGYYQNDRLTYCGRVGTGFSQESLETVKAKLDERPAKAPPFHDPPTGSPDRDVHWVKPELVAEIEFGSWTEDGMLRHPTFLGQREDKDPREVTREIEAEAVGDNGKTKGKSSKTKFTAKKPRAGSSTKSATGGGATVAGVRISNPGRVLYPDQGLTKLDLAHYYETVADWILPYVVDRPVTLVRCPRGHGQKCFYQKHLTESMPESIEGVEVEESGGTGLYVSINTPADLITLVQLGALELHPWGSRKDKLDRPDMMIFDLDPGEGVVWKAVVQAAHTLREHLEEIGLVSYLRTTGGKGLHLVAPLTRRSSWSEVKSFSKDLADAMVRTDRDKYIATASKAKRRGKIYIDYLRNERGATAVASYSTRARKGAPVATPIRWDELSADLAPNHFNTSNLPRRLASLSSDPWEGFFDVRQSITKAMARQVSQM